MYNSAHGTKVPNLYLLVAASISVNMLALALPIMMMQIYNRILPGQATDTLFILSSGVIVAAAMDFLLKMARHRILSQNSVNFEVNATRLMLSRIFGAKATSYNHYPAVRMLQDMSAISRLKDKYNGITTITFLLDLPFIAIFFCLIGYLAGPIALVPALTLAVYGFVLYRHGCALRSLITDSERHDERRYDFISSALLAVHTIKANCLEAVATRRFEALQGKAARISYSAPYLSGRVDILNSSLAQIMTIVLIVIGAPMVVNHSMTIGTLIASILLAGQMVQPFQRTIGLWIRQQDNWHAELRIHRLLNLPQMHKNRFEAGIPAHGRLHLENASFAYHASKPLLEKINLEVEAGTTISIQGVAGSGTTTLLELTSGLYQPTEGRVCYAGIETCTMDAHERAKSIAYLPMRGLILRGSIMENLTGFDTRLQTSAHEISSLLGIDTAVALLPQGYDTQLEGMNTDVISPGLRQRISIARALLHRPQLILFDNADHGLDKESYALVFNLLARLRGQATLIIVSEDKNITSLADQEWQISNGSLIPISDTDTHLIAGVAQ